VPGASGIQNALREFRAGGPGVVTALNTNLLRCAADLMGEDEEELRSASFGEVVKECLGLCDEEPKSHASHGLFVAALARTCENIDTDSPFGGSARFAGFHRALANTWEELYSWGLSSEKLEEAASLVEGETANKLRSMALLERDASEILNSLGFESGTAQIERSLECKPGKGSKLPRVLVLAGSELQPMAAQWIRWMAENGADVVVATDRPLEIGLFATAAAFTRLVNLGQGAMDLRLGGEETLAQESSSTSLCDALFTDKHASGKPDVQINSCSDALAEAEWALRGCIRDMQRGLQPEEIAIYARNLEEYACPLESAAKRLGVPIRMSRRVPVLTNRFARLVLEALEFCASEDPRLIIPLLGCTYLGLDRSLAADIRSEARLAYKAKKNAWPVFTGWAESKNVEIPWLARILHWRDDASRTPQSLRSWSGRLQGLIDILPWHGSSGEGPTRARDMRVPTALRRAIRNLASVRADDQDRPLSLAEFAKLCRAIWDDEQYSIPSSGRGVAVVNSAQSMGEVRSVYAVGMLEGVFPRRRSEDPILTDDDRNEISRALSLDPPLQTSLDRASQERDEFYRLCAAAQDSLTLSYPQADDNRDNVPAFYLHEAERAAEKVGKQDHPRVPFAPLADECLSPADRKLRLSLDLPREDALPVHFLTQEVRDQMAWPADEAFSPQDLRDALRCEFRHFASKRLGLRPNRDSSRWLRLQGIPRAVRLLQQADVGAAQNALEVALDAELDQVYGEVPDWELALMRSGGKRLISEWIQREFAARKIWPKVADSLKVDLPFGAPGIRDRMPGDVPLGGTVPAVSRMGPYAVTHLYETQPPKREGALDGGPLADLDVLYYGLHFLARHQPGQPTAVEVESMHGIRTLLVLPRVAEMPLPSRTQDGLHVVDLSGGADGPLAQKAFFDEVKRRLKRAVSRLKQSGVQPTPGEHCAWCGYGELCRRSLDFSEEDATFGVDDFGDQDD
jgi:hypothetical protein